MDSASVNFVLYGLAAAWVMSWSAAEAWRVGVLLLASALFLGLVGATPIGFIPLAGFLLFGFLSMRFVDRARVLFPVLVIATLLGFTYLKKYTFFPDRSTLAFPYFTLGLSYIFFRVLHLIIEARETARADRPGGLHYLAYTLNFTTLVSGPIQRYADFKTSLPAAAQNRLDAEIVLAQLARIAVGYFKVNVLASALDILRIDALIALGGPGTGTHFLPVLSLILVYPFFLYANFSGYIDIVIALARLMKICLPENFDRPFAASSFLDFWNRWHITLSQWLKIYVYNPLLIFFMRRTTSVPLQSYLGVVCFFVTFFLIGVWHGRTSEFAVFGLLQGGGVAINKLWQIFIGKRLGKKRYRALAADLGYVALGRGLTFSWFAFTMFWFWGDWQQIGTVARSLPPAAWVAVWLLVIAVASVGLTAWELLRERLFSSASRRRAWSAYVLPALLGVVLFSSFFYCALLDQPAPGIVYKAF